MNRASGSALVISRIAPSDLTAESIKQLSAFTEQKYFCCFQGVHPLGVTETESFIFAATLNDQFIGLIVASFIPILRLAEVHSLCVQEDFRNQNIASKLLQQLQQELYKNSCLVLTFSYASDNPSASILESFLTKNGWNPPKNFLMYCEFKSSEFNPPWLGIQPPLLPEFTEFPWSKITSAEEKKLQFLESQKAFPMEVSPFKSNEGEMEPINSLGLKHKDQIIGWIITYRVKPNTIRYSSLFIYPEYQKLGIAIRLLSDAIIKHIEAGVEIGELEINLERIDVTWLNFVKKRLMPYANKVTYIKKSWYHLKPTCATIPGWG